MLNTGKTFAVAGSLTDHGGHVMPAGCSLDVFINGKPAAKLTSVHCCPQATPGTPPVPHGVGTPCLSPGAQNVLINGVPAIGEGHAFLCIGAAPAKIKRGSPKVVFGAGSGAAPVAPPAGKPAPKETAAKTVDAAEPTAKPVAPTGVAAESAAPSGGALIGAAVVGGLAGVAAGAVVGIGVAAAALTGALVAKGVRGMFRDDGDGYDPDKDTTYDLTVKDFAEVLTAIENKRGYEAARHYAANCVSYVRISEMSRRFTLGIDEDPDNDPNLMPSRFMLLFGADDGELRRNGNIGNHPDQFSGQPAHEMSVANLRKGLRSLGYDLEESGPYDANVHQSFLRYLNRFETVNLDNVAANEVGQDEPLGNAVLIYGLPSWKHLYAGANAEQPPRIDHNRITGEFSNEYGDGLVAEKGADVRKYKNGVPYRYPWAPFSLTVALGESYKNRKNVPYEIFYKDALGKEAILAEGKFSSPFKIETLLPDAEDVGVRVDGVEVELRQVGCEKVVGVDTKKEPEMVSDNNAGAAGKDNLYEPSPHKLTAAARNAVAFVKRGYKDSIATCNISLQQAFKELTGSDELARNAILTEGRDPNMKANDIYDCLVGNRVPPSPNFVRVSIDDMQELANKGHIVIGTWKNPSGGSGHVVMGVPGKEVEGNWRHDAGNVIVRTTVPVVLETGPNRRHESIGINWSYGRAHHEEVLFFRYKKTTLD